MMTKKKTLRRGRWRRRSRAGALPVALIFHFGEASSSAGIICDKKRASKSTNLSFLRLGGRWIVDVFARAYPAGMAGIPFGGSWISSSFPRAIRGKEYRLTFETTRSNYRCFGML